MNKIFRFNLLCLTIFITSNISAFRFITSSISSTRKIAPRIIPDPKHTKFTFGLQGVVLEHNITRIKEHILKKETLPKLVNVFNVRLMACVLRLAARKATAEEYVLLFEEYNRPEIAKLVKNAAYEQEPNKDTIAIMKELKELGYKIDMISNIGKDHLEDLETKPELRKTFKLFSHKKYTDYKKPAIQKSLEQYFVDYLEQYNRKNKMVVYIDCNKKKVEAARKVGMVGIYFQNAQQLRTELEKLGIFKKKK